LDQKAVAGIGNIYASELLHRARIHPATPCNQLRASAWQRIHVQTRAVLEEAISCQGSTLSDGNYGTAKHEPGRFQDRHRVYQRNGESCMGCGRAEIVRIVQAQRSTFFCPHCQRPR
jgi:formamidopyrimidine-DNA glycosylase